MKYKPKKGGKTEPIDSEKLDRWMQKYELRLINAVLKPYMSDSSEQQKKALLQQCWNRMQQENRHN